MTASPENLLAILVMALAAMAAKAGGFLAMRWLGQHRFVAAWLEHAPGAVLVSAAIVPIVHTGGAFWIGERQPSSPPDGQAVSCRACSWPSAQWPWPGGPASAESVSVGC